MPLVFMYVHFQTQVCYSGPPYVAPWPHQCRTASGAKMDGEPGTRSSASSEMTAVAVSRTCRMLREGSSSAWSSVARNRLPLGSPAKRLCTGLASSRLRRGPVFHRGGPSMVRRRLPPHSRDAHTRTNHHDTATHARHGMTRYGTYPPPPPRAPRRPRTAPAPPGASAPGSGGHRPWRRRRSNKRDAP